MKKSISAFVDVEVPFHDVDVMGVVWHGHYLKYFEQARTALFQKIGFDYPQMSEIGYVWPVVSVTLSTCGRYDIRSESRSMFRWWNMKIDFSRSIIDNG